MSVTARPTQADREDRFAFGKNWTSFVRQMRPEQVDAAVASMVELLGAGDLSGRRFLDVGCGSGLMSLAAHRLGAQVTAFDFDGDSVAASVRLRDEVAGVDAYRVLQGSVLDSEFLAGLGMFDVVYAWGVLHHTGHLWQACDNVGDSVAPGGHLALAIYNDQGAASLGWCKVKQAYVSGGPTTRAALLGISESYFRGRALVTRLWRGRPSVDRPRGMDRWHDLVDWVGGYPFEVARPEEVFRFYRDRGFVLVEMTTCAGGLGCNQFVFRRDS